MQVEVNTKEFQAGLKKALVALTRGTDPFRRKILLETKEDVLGLTFDEWGLRIMVEIPVIQIQIPGSVVVDINTLKLITKIKDTALTIGTNFIRAGKKMIMFKPENPVDFFGGFEECHVDCFEATPLDLLDALVVRYASMIDEGRPSFNSVAIIKEHFVATDTHRLAHRKMNFENKNWDTAIVPLLAIKALAKLIDKKSTEPIQCKRNIDTIQFILPNITIQARLIDGQFPDWEKVIPTEFKTTIKVDASQIISELLFLGGSIKGYSTLIFSTSDDGIMIRAKLETNTIELEIPAEVTGEHLGEMGINYYYLIDVLKNTKELTVEIKLAGRLTPIVINGDIALPVRLGDGK